MSESAKAKRGQASHGRRSAAAPAASAEPARGMAGRRRLRPSDAAARSAAGPGRRVLAAAMAGPLGLSALELNHAVRKSNERREMENLEIGPEHDSQSSDPETCDLRATKRLPGLPNLFS
eukprot:963618-Prymnesium_polylepis.2